MNKRIILLLLVLLIIGVFSFVELYRSEWMVNASSSVVTISPGEAVFQPWNRIWLAPLNKTGQSGQGELVAAVQKHLQVHSLNGELAPQYLDEQSLPGPSPVALLIESDWEINRSLKGWKAAGMMIVQTVGLADDLATKTVNFQASIAAAGTYTGWLKRATVEAQLIDQLAGKLAESLANELRKQGQALPEPQPQEEVVKRSSLQFTWPWSAKDQQPKPSQGSVPTDIAHPQIAQGAEIDYYWQLASKTAVVYRVQQSGTALEEQLLAPVTGSVKDREFQNAVHNRRHWSSWDLQMTHWAVDADREDWSDQFGQNYEALQDDIIWRRVLIVQK